MVAREDSVVTSVTEVMTSSFDGREEVVETVEGIRDYILKKLFILQLTGEFEVGERLRQKSPSKSLF